VSSSVKLQYTTVSDTMGSFSVQKIPVEKPTDLSTSYDEWIDID